MNTITDTIRNLGAARLGMMIAVAAGVLAFFIYLTSRLATPELTLLYSDLDLQDSGRIVGHLEQAEVRYRLDRDGTQIFVPRDQVARMRVAMAEQGLPIGGSIGYEIFDRSEGLGTSSFVQNVNHLRALEGELARTIRSIAQVRQARVHLVLPKRELFSRNRQNSTASIVVTTRGGQRLERQQILAIQHLVSAAVPGLKPSMVSIIDSKGTLLARSANEDELETAVSNAEEMRLAYETRMVRMIEDLLARSVGPGNVRAQVTVEMDFDRVTENAEIFDPDGQVVRSTQTIEEESGSLEGEALAPVTIDGSLPDSDLGPISPNGSQTGDTRNEETVNYEISRTVKTLVRETGVVRRLSVAILVNGVTTVTPEGEIEYTPRGEEELERLAALARAAVGFDEERGDRLETVNLRFVQLAETLQDAGDAGFFGFDEAQIMRIAEVLMLGVVAVLVLLLVVRPLVGRVVEGGIEGGAMKLTDQSGARAALAAPTAPAVSAARETQALPSQPDSENEVVANEIEQMIDLNKVEGRVRASSVRKIGEIVDKHPDEAVAIVRSWLYQEA